MLPLILTAVFAGTFLAVVAAVAATRPMVEAPARKQPADGDLDPDNPAPVEWTPDLDSNLLRDESLSTIGFWSGLLERIDGIEILEKHIAEAGLEHLAEIREEDIRNVDLSPATVLTLYLYPGANLRLRPAIVRQLKPGSRVISLQFTMGSWKPDRVEQMTDATGISRTLYLWLIK